MPKVVFTANLNRHIECPPREVVGETLRETLNSVFAENPKLKGYILDDQKQLRQHVVIFLDGKPLIDRKNLTDSVTETTEVYVMQALSGG